MKKIGITCYPTVGGSGIIATELGKLLAQQNYEVHFITSSLPFRLVCVNRNVYYHDVKIVTTLHGTDITVLGFDKLFKRMITYGIENSDAVTAVSQGLVNQTKNHLHVKKDIEVIYNFVNEADYQKKERTFLKEHY